MQTWCVCRSLHLGSKLRTVTRAARPFPSRARRGAGGEGESAHEGGAGEDRGAEGVERARSADARGAMRARIFRRSTRTVTLTSSH